MHELKPFAQSLVHCRIYQADFDQVMDLMFSAPPADGSPRCIPSEKYVLVFDGGVSVTNLYDLYKVFNVAHPADYTGRSLSPTDVVEIVDEQSHAFYMCENFGWSTALFDVNAIHKTPGRA